MKSSISHKIKHRAKSNDIFITPLELSKKQIDFIEYKITDIWFDPFKNSGSYYNQFPKECKKEWCEILYKRDFFNFYKKIDIISSNPPWSILDKVIKKSIELKPRVISYLIGVGNLTTRRIEMFNKGGYSLTKIHLCKIFRWYGMSCIVQFELLKNNEINNLISFDRKVWRTKK